ncbi:MAG: virion morphogenesis protein [Delftia acidovorans]|nr:MAG: virion morphogenesis protein [Delftia acidovorans]
MSVLSVHVQLSGFETIESALARLNPFKSGVLLEALARLIRESARERVLSGGPAPDGSAWKANLEGRTPILHRSGALARSIDYAVIGNRIEVGSGLIYAAIHQFGGVIKPKTAKALRFTWNDAAFGVGLATVKQVTMPARPYIGLSADDRAELVQATVGYVRSLFP